ncbi:hypothetical protein [Paenibacillus graminis]|uniref:hypothetical protein n=1 Tax=Paenibacillus graminis TaxID=189425 RepID=UPI0004715256|nr:hypothetical protein [Paenibacillus graminis]
MRVVIVNCFDTYEERIDLIYDFFENKGHEVTVIQSDFRHFKKVKRTEDKPGFIFIQSKPYYKNMSLTRLISHYKFAKKAFEVVGKLQPDLLYTIVPPNSLAMFAAKYKKKNRNTMLIFDLIDLWPETMPIGKISSFPPFTFWRLMRDKSLKISDLIVTECNHYQSILANELKSINTQTVYLAKREVNIERYPIFNNARIHLCYLGSINNIIDIPKIKKIIKSINELKSTTLHIIGDGESKQVLIDEVISTGANVEFYGKIYDLQEKQKIFDKCHFGLNIMKDNVCVGLTMKSIDYFQHGLPIINNIKADTTNLVEDYCIGMNITDDNLLEVAERIALMKESEWIFLKNNTDKVFIDFFSKESFDESLEKAIGVYC